MSHAAIAIVDGCRRGFINTLDVWTWVYFAVEHHPDISRRLLCAVTEYAAQIREH